LSASTWIAQYIPPLQTPQQATGMSTDAPNKRLRSQFRSLRGAGTASAMNSSELKGSGISRSREHGAAFSALKRPMRVRDARHGMREQ
jgi:hypothetical protein